MRTRQPCAINFYRAECSKKVIDGFLKGFSVPERPSKIVAGIVPHAGWMYSGAVAAKVMKSICEKSTPTTFIILGAVHTFGIKKCSVYAQGSWLTPFGEIEVDGNLAKELLDSIKTYLIEDPEAHSHEHSIEVQLPFIKYFFPEAKIVPIMIIPDDDSAFVGQRIGEIIHEIDKEIVVIGTTDLTHYGDNYGFAPQGYGPKAFNWMRENDARIINLTLSLKAEEIVKEARKNHNACGAGALAATTSAAKAMGADEGVLIEYTTSHDVIPEREFHMGVGYAGIVF